MENIMTSLDLGVFPKILHPLLHYNSFLLLFLALFIGGFILSFNPCMLAILPLILSGNRRSYYKRPLLFAVGFVTTLMAVGLLAAGLGRVLALPSLFWYIVLAVFYLMLGLYLLRIKLPIQITGFYVNNKKLLFRVIYTNEGVNPWLLGSFFALSPSPCTTPVILALSSYAAASGNLALSILALASFALGHSLLLAFAFLPNTQKLFKTALFSRFARPILGILLIVLAFYLVAFQPDLMSSGLISHDSMNSH